MSAPSHDERRATYASLLLALLATAAAWGAVPWGTFQFDDFRNVVRDPATTDLAVLLERLPHGLRPLTRLSYFFDAQLYGLHAAGFLSTNFLLHAITVLLVFALARRRLSDTGALLAALLFAVQPANAEVVAYVSGRSTGLMTPLLLGGLLLYDLRRRIAALVLFVLACLAKEHALVFPALVLVWELSRPSPQPSPASATGSGMLRAEAKRDLLAVKIVAFVVAAALLSIARYRALLADAFDPRTIGENLLANGRAIPEMLSLWFRPWALSADHAFSEHGHFGASIAGLGLLLALVAVAFVYRRRVPMLMLAIAWPLIVLLPTNSILSKPDLVTEKPLYLAWVGVAIALGAGLAALLSVAASRGARRIVISAVGLVLCALIGASIWRAALWRDPVALWTDAVAKAPYKSRCWNNLGMANLVQQREQEAVVAFERAVFLDPANEYAALNLFTARALCGSKCPGP